MAEHAHRIGEPFDASIATWIEGASFNFAPGGCALVIAAAHPSADLVSAIQDEPIRMALARPPNVPQIYVCYSFGRQAPWGAIPMAYQRLSATARGVLAKEAETDSPLVIVLVDASDGVVRALRAITLAHGLVRRLHGVLIDQSHRAWAGEDGYHAALQAVAARYSPSALVAQWAMVTQGTGLASDALTVAELRAPHARQ